AWPGHGDAVTAGGDQGKEHRELVGEAEKAMGGGHRDEAGEGELLFAEPFHQAADEPTLDDAADEAGEAVDQPGPLDVVLEATIQEEREAAGQRSEREAEGEELEQPAPRRGPREEPSEVERTLAGRRCGGHLGGDRGAGLVRVGGEERGGEEDRGK